MGSADDPGTGGPDPDPRWCRAAGWVHRTVGDHVIAKGRNGEDRTLGGLAAAVWIVLDTPATRAGVASRIAEEWPSPTVEPATLDEALTLLTENGLLVEDHIATG